MKKGINAVVMGEVTKVRCCEEGGEVFCCAQKKKKEKIESSHRTQKI